MIDKNALNLHDSITDEADPLTLELEDQEFIEVINASIADSQGYYDEKRLAERQNKNLEYYLGHQTPAKDIVSYQTPFVENVVYEGIRRIKPIASSRLPDLTVKQGPAGSKESAEKLSDLFNTDIN